MTHVNIGDKIRVNYMKDEPHMTGAEGTVKYIDDFGQIHCLEFGLAVLPDMDEYEVIERASDVQG